MRRDHAAVLTGAFLLAGTGYAVAQGQTLTIATVNNADMIIMQRLSPKWEQASGHKLNWVVLEENVLRQRVTTDIDRKSTRLNSSHANISYAVFCLKKKKNKKATKLI